MLGKARWCAQNPKECYEEAKHVARVRVVQPAVEAEYKVREKVGRAKQFVREEGRKAADEFERVAPQRVSGAVRKVADEVRYRRAEHQADKDLRHKYREKQREADRTTRARVTFAREEGQARRRQEESDMRVLCAADPEACRKVKEAKADKERFEHLKRNKARLDEREVRVQQREREDELRHRERAASTPGKFLDAMMTFGGDVYDEAKYVTKTGAHNVGYAAEIKKSKSYMPRIRRRKPRPQKLGRYERMKPRDIMSDMDDYFDRII